MNVEVATLVPAAAANVTFTPLCQLLLFSVTGVGVAVIAVPPERLSVTGTAFEGAACKRIVDVPLDALIPRRVARHSNSSTASRLREAHSSIVLDALAIEK